jgi:hypothetical protein
VWWCHNGWVSDGDPVDDGVVSAVDSDRDFLVSYTQVDRFCAEWVAWTLEDAGFTVLIQAWDFVPGSNWVTGMDEGVSRVVRTVAVLSDAYAGSVFGRAEWQAACASDPVGAARKLLVVRVADCVRPGLLGQVASVDLFGMPEDKARSALVAAARSAVSGGRAKPRSTPGFPGGARAVPAPPGYPGSGGADRVGGRVRPVGGGIQIGNVSATGGQAVGVNDGQMIQYRGGSSL